MGYLRPPCVHALLLGVEGTPEQLSKAKVSGGRKGKLGPEGKKGEKIAGQKQKSCTLPIPEVNVRGQYVHGSKLEDTDSSKNCGKRLGRTPLTLWV